MKPASRTPEGEPNRCAVCGKSITLEHSIPPGDAPCPYCGCLVWFDSTGGPVEVPRETIEQTKQKIQQLVREVAKLAHDDIEPSEFYWEFLTRVVRSLAAVGGAVWLLEDRRWPISVFQRQRLRAVCELNVPSRLLGRKSLEGRQHYRLLEYAIASNQEQLVSPLSGAADQRMGGNPTHQLLLVNPLWRKGNRPAGVVEIFQRADTLPVTQRGYQQFLKMMCRLGSEYLDREPASVAKG